VHRDGALLPLCKIASEEEEIQGRDREETSLYVALRHHPRISPTSFLEMAVASRKDVPLSRENSFSWTDREADPTYLFIPRERAKRRASMNDDDTRSKMHSRRFAPGTQRFSDICRHRADTANSICTTPLDNSLWKTYQIATGAAADYQLSMRTLTLRYLWSANVTLKQSSESQAVFDYRLLRRRSSLLKLFKRPVSPPPTRIVKFLPLIDPRMIRTNPRLHPLFTRDIPREYVKIREWT